MYINQHFPNIIQFKFHTRLQCIQISTRINSSSVHMYIFVCFIRNSSNNSTWCQNRGCSYISSRRRIYRSNPAVSCIFPSILNISTVELQFYYNFQGGRKTAISAKCHWIQGLQSSSTWQNLHSKRQQGSPGSPCAVQVPHVQYRFPVCSTGSPVCSSPCFQAFYPAETSFYAA